MKSKNKRTFLFLLLAGCTLLAYVILVSLRPVEIVIVHKYRHFSDVLVKTFPLTDSGKIEWWLKHKDMIKDKYGLPKPDEDGSFNIVFWDFGEGYKETDGYDRLCFDDMSPPLNCIDKKRIFSVESGRGSDILFTVHDGIYRMEKNGIIKKIYPK